MDAVYGDERKTASLLQSNLTRMRSYWEMFEAAVFLYARADKAILNIDGISRFDAPWMAHRWALLGCREGTMNIYHFRKVMGAANDQAFLCPSIRPHLDTAALGRAQERFRSLFPDFEALRNSVAHLGEIGHTADALEKNGFRDRIEVVPGVTFAGDGGIMSENIINDIYTNTGFNGRLLRYSVTPDTVIGLHDVEQDFFSGFDDYAASFK